MMKRIFSEPNPIFIYHLKDLLAEKGIATIIKNELLTGGAGELPPTEVWPELWIVDNEDKEIAKGIVNEFLQSTKTNPQSWKCQNCGEVIEGQFNICWRCGKETN